MVAASTSISENISDPFLYMGAYLDRCGTNQGQVPCASDGSHIPGLVVYPLFVDPGRSQGGGLFC
jgi:hypothetical protein